MPTYFVSTTFVRPGADLSKVRSTEVFLPPPPAATGAAPEPPEPEKAQAERAAALEAEVATRLAAWRERAAGIRGKHAAVEVLWDGDTDGWFVSVSVVTARRAWWLGAEEYTVHPLDCLRYGGDARLFAGVVPPFPEALVARRAGEMLARELGAELYFPSPDDPDDHCAPFSARGAAVRCRTCRKPMVPSRGPAAPVDQCWPCHGREEKERELLDDPPGGLPGLNCVVVEDGRLVRSGFFALVGQLSRGASRLLDVLEARQPPERLSHRIDTALLPEEAAVAASACQAGLDAALTTYRVPEEVPPPARELLAFTWGGVERTVEVRFDQRGGEIRSLLAWWELLSACTGPRELLVVGNAGVSRRDVAILARLHPGGGTCTMVQLGQAFRFLPAEVLQGTVASLVRRGFLAHEDDALRLTLRGWVQGWSGPP